MGWFSRKKKPVLLSPGGPDCPQCSSRQVKLKVNYGNDQADYVKTWRGRRYLTYYCEQCQTEFSVEEKEAGTNIQEQIGSELIDDEEALKSAEEDLKRQADEEGDHRFG